MKLQGDEPFSEYEKMYDMVIFREKGIYACFPNLYTVHDTLILSFSTRNSKSHYDGSGGSKTLISTDSVRTWKPPDKKYLFPEYKKSDGSYVIPSAKGWREVKKDDIEAYNNQGKMIMESNGKYWQATGAFIKTINDKGETLQIESLTLLKHALLLGYNFSSYLRLNDGIRILGLYGRVLQDDKQDQVFILRSADDGLIWSFNKMYLSDSIVGDIGLNEAAFVELNEKEIISMIRSTDGYLYSSISKNGGERWSVPQKTDIWGYPANLIKIDEVKILCTYGFRKKPIGIRAIVLDGESLHPLSEEFIIRNDAVGNPGDNGYPITVQLADNSFFTCYYITLADGITHIAGTRWKLKI